MQRSIFVCLCAFLAACWLPDSTDACQACWWPRIPLSANSRHHHHLHHHQATTAVSSHVIPVQSPGSMALAVTAARQTSQQLHQYLQRILQTVSLANFLQLSVIMAVAVGGSVAIEAACRRHAPFTTKRRQGIFMTTNEDSSDAETSDDKDEEASSDTESTEEPPLSSAMIATIGVYKNFISPLLPPACRFVPTCSQYGVQAIQEFGPTKGVILTSWRLLRCSPLGGKGYDPPKWPPVSYTYSSY